VKKKMQGRGSEFLCGGKGCTKGGGKEDDVFVCRQLWVWVLIFSGSTDSYPTDVREISFHFSSFGSLPAGSPDSATLRPHKIIHKFIKSHLSPTVAGQCKVLSRVTVSKDRVRIGNWIYY
jgi:hypothetical protein